MPNKIFRDLPKLRYFEGLVDFQKEKTQQFSAIVLTLIALSLFGLFAINPTLGTIAKLKKELKDAQFVDQRLSEKIKNLSTLQQKYSQIQTDVPVVLSSLPKSPEVPLLLAQIQSIAENSNIRIETLQNFQVELFKPQSVDQKYHSYSFSLSGVGSFENISKFLSSITSMQRIANIEVFSINKTPKEELLRVTLQGIAYYKK